MNEEEPLTDEQKKTIAALDLKGASDRRRFRHSPFLIFGIVLPLMAAAALIFFLFIPMMVCSGSPAAVILVCVALSLLQSASS